MILQKSGKSHFLYFCVFSKLKAMMIMFYSVFPSLLIVMYFEDLYTPGLGWALGMRRTEWILSSQRGLRQVILALLCY